MGDVKKNTGVEAGAKSDGSKTEVRFVWRQCKIFASGVNFSRNNAIHIINESTKYILS